MSPSSSSTTAERSNVEYEPLNVDPDTPLAGSIEMGSGEAFLKPEGRQGDVAAQWVAYVRLVF